MAIDVAGRVDLDGRAGENANDELALNAIAIFDGQQWASLCPELDIASVAATPDEALDNLITAVTEAVSFARENNLEPGHPVPAHELRAFIIGSQAAYVGRNFSV